MYELVCLLWMALTPWGMDRSSWKSERLLVKDSLSVNTTFSPIHLGGHHLKHRFWTGVFSFCVDETSGESHSFMSESTLRGSPHCFQSHSPMQTTVFAKWQYEHNEWATPTQILDLTPYLCAELFLSYSIVATSNVKTVKEQKFHKRSDIWSQWNQNVWDCSRNCLIEIE